jgi:hypothetical protein
MYCTSDPSTFLIFLVDERGSLRFFGHFRSMIVFLAMIGRRFLGTAFLGLRLCIVCESLRFIVLGMAFDFDLEGLICSSRS